MRNLRGVRCGEPEIRESTTRVTVRHTRIDLEDIDLIVTKIPYIFYVVPTCISPKEIGFRIMSGKVVSIRKMGQSVGETECRRVEPFISPIEVVPVFGMVAMNPRVFPEMFPEFFQGIQN